MLPGAGSVGPSAFLAPELSPPAYTQAGTRAWVPFRGTRVQWDGSAPDTVGGGETGTTAGTLVLLALGMLGALSRHSRGAAAVLGWGLRPSSRSSGIPAPLAQVGGPDCWVVAGVRSQILVLCFEIKTEAPLTQLGNCTSTLTVETGSVRGGVPPDMLAL